MVSTFVMLGKIDATSEAFKLFISYDFILSFLANKTVNVWLVSLVAGQPMVSHCSRPSQLPEMTDALAGTLRITWINSEEEELGLP